MDREKISKKRRLNLKGTSGAHSSKERRRLLSVEQVSSSPGAKPAAIDSKQTVSTCDILLMTYCQELLKELFLPSPSANYRDFYPFTQNQPRVLPK